MLVLSRKPMESILIGEIEVTVVDIRGDKVRLAIDAPPNVSVDRLEVRKAKLRGEPRPPKKDNSSKETDRQST